LSGLALVYISGDGTRGRALYSIMVVITFATYVFRIKRRVVPILGVFILVILMGFSFLSNKGVSWTLEENPISVGASKIIQRFSENGMNDVYTIELVRSGIVQYQNGDAQMTLLLNAIPGSSFGGLSFSNQLAYLLSGNSSTTTYASMTYLGTVFVDFGIPGVLVIFTVLGLVVGIVQRIVLDTRKDHERMPLVAFTVFYCGFLTVGGFAVFVPILIMATAFYLFFKLCVHIGAMSLPRVPLKE
ncbi:MAG: hypothetical protein M1305_07550, partial [Candidatus Marsarchaeota archaeon]|nr:hypothetical protein [Candidatus Marsarchaeota archaeon]